jgi:general nucleoside transport system permease protein
MTASMTMAVLASIDWASISPVLIVASMLRLGTPIVFASLGETFSQRAGVINIGIEGVMLSSCCVAATASYVTGSVLAGFVGAVIGGIGVMAVTAVLVLRYRADQIVVGVGINLAALGVTTIAAKQKPELNNVDALRVWRIPVLKDLPFIGRAVFQQKPSVYVLFVVVVAATALLNRTSWGLRVKASGETPAAADAAGVTVTRIRLQAMLLCGALVGLGGGAYALGTTQGFTENMVAGRGFIALVAVIFGRWRPLTVAAGCAVFAFFEAASLSAPGWGIEVPSQLLNSVPYLASLVALIVLRKGANPPSALSIPFERTR